MPVQSLRFALCAATALFASLGCASFNTSLSSQWKDSKWTAPPMHSLFVLAASKDASRRRVWEDEFSAKLAQRGIVATQSYLTFPDALPTPDQVREAIRQQPFDGVITVRLVDIREEETFVPPTRRTGLVGLYRSPYWGYYGNLYAHSGYVGVTSIVAVETSVWDARDEKGMLVWSGTTDSLDPEDSEDLAEDVAKRVAGALSNAGIVK